MNSASRRRHKPPSEDPITLLGSKTFAYKNLHLFSPPNPTQYAIGRQLFRRRGGFHEIRGLTQGQFEEQTHQLGGYKGE